MQDGLQRAVGVPLALAERVHALWPYLKEMAAYGNIACKSDAQVTRKSQKKIPLMCSMDWIARVQTEQRPWQYFLEVVRVESHACCPSL